MNSIVNNSSLAGYRGFFGRCLAVLLTGLLLGGCASGGNPRDPIEPINRAVYGFNDGFDRAIAKPIAEGYKSVVPEIARTGVTNFFSNLEDVWILVNNLFQGKVESALDDMARVLVNSTVGLFGIVDIASDLGIAKHNEDFGQTLGRWGVGSGPYLVLPFLGSSTLRDALGMGLMDMQGDIVRQLKHVPTRNTLLATRIINTRANFLDVSRIVEEAALDKYIYVRDAHLQRRRSLIYDGSPPRDTSAAAEEEADSATASAAEPSQGSPASSDKAAEINLGSVQITAAAK